MHRLSLLTRETQAVVHIMSKGTHSPGGPGAIAVFALSCCTAAEASLLGFPGATCQETTCYA